MELTPFELAQVKGIIFTEKLRVSMELTDIVEQLRKSRKQALDEDEQVIRDQATADATELDSILGTILRKETSPNAH